MNTPSPVGVTLVSAAADVLSHIVWSDPIEPEMKLFTVTLIVFVTSVHAFPPIVDVT